MDSNRLTRLVSALQNGADGLAPIEGAEPVAGGDSYRALRLVTSDGDRFVKWGRREDLPVFEAEYAGLEALAAAPGPRVPRPLACGRDDSLAWLVTEYLPLRPVGDAAALGRALARLHAFQGPTHGFDADNFIGRTPQRNDRHPDWPYFWWTSRLAPQLELAARRGFADALEHLASPLEQACRTLLDHGPAPSLLHGDLWSGNHAYLADGTPVIFDPACSHGDRETDLAMMRLFGGFHPDVYRAYEEHWVLPGGHERRRTLYQLYHVLNHLNLFGASWLGRTESLAREVLAAADEA